MGYWQPVQPVASTRALKGRQVIAQGEALGKGKPIREPCRAAPNSLNEPRLWGHVYLPLLGWHTGQKLLLRWLITIL